MSVMRISPKVLNIGERVLNGALVSYFALWQSAGLDFKHLFTLANVQGAVVGGALALAACLGLQNVGNRSSGGYF